MVVYKKGISKSKEMFGLVAWRIEEYSIIHFDIILEVNDYQKYKEFIPFDKLI
jgi:hypothetical protein